MREGHRKRLRRCERSAAPKWISNTSGMPIESNRNTIDAPNKRQEESTSKALHMLGACVAMPLIGSLFDGPIDIVGDIHGECGALLSLLDRLGYDGQGEHPEGRRLVFIGDLVDRGPDSPGVLRLVRQLVQRKRAQCVLGNHELNLLRGERASMTRYRVDKA